MTSDDRRALAGLRERSLPEWYDDAKFGIFIHWGLYSVPAFAPKAADVVELLRTRFDTLQAELPYVEWYWQAMRVEGSATQRFHEATYGPGFEYPSFREEFEQNLEGFDAAEWAHQFRRAGARYVVLVSKHHDGYTMWPSRIENPKRPGWSCPRDLVGELAEAVRSEGMRFGTYYSGGLDWTWSQRGIRTPVDVFADQLTDPAYNRYVDAHYREIIERYEPAVLWNDISYPTDRGLYRLLADYYERVPDGVINDRWIPAGWLQELARNSLGRAVFSAIGKRLLARLDGPFVGPEPKHCDFRTPEFSLFERPQRKKWETTRGMGLGFGHNRTETDEDMLSRTDLVELLVDAVAGNGNLLLNVGPDAEGKIPPTQLKRLEWIGGWLGRCGEAIYATRPWILHETSLEGGFRVRFTTRGRDVFALVCGSPTGERLLEGVRADPSRVEQLGTGVVPARDSERGLVVDFGPSSANDPAVALRLPEAVPLP